MAGKDREEEARHLAPAPGSVLFLSVVIPFFNEADPAGPLLQEVRRVLERETFPSPVQSGAGFEVIAVDDGSDDGTGALLDAVASGWPALRVVHHLSRCGQSAALASGCAAARGEWIGTLDGDGQSDPADLPRLLECSDGFEMITGIRARRRDSLIRRASSRIAFRVRDAVLHDGIIDTGCSTRVFRHECLRYLPLQVRGMHRFLPALFQIAGYRVKQMPVNHRPRLGGRAKYGIGNRMIPGLLDLYAVRWMKSRYAPPEAGIPGSPRAPAGK
jgi:dolichol-phosphate mannosyltransferase